jgi:hypothetical protein
MTKIAINPDDVLKPGEVIELNFDLAGPSWLWLQAAQSAAIESRLKKQYDNFEIKSYEWTEDNSKLAITIKITAPPAFDPEQNRQGAGVNITAVVICAAIMTSAIVYWFTQGTTYKIIQTAAPAMSLMALAVIVVVALKLFGKGAFAK